MQTHSEKSSTIEQVDTITGDAKDRPTPSPLPVHAVPEVIGTGDGTESGRAGQNADEIQASNRGYFAYFKTRNFYLVLLLG